MSIENLKKNIEQEKKILADMNSVLEHMGNDENNDFYTRSLQSLMYQLKSLNNTIPSLLEEVSVSGLKGKKKKSDVSNISYVSPSNNEKNYISLGDKDKKKYLQELRISEIGKGRMNRERKKEDDKKKVRKPNYFAIISNRLFFKFSDKLAPKFSGLSDDLKKGNIPILTATYISMALFFSLVGFVLSFFTFVFLAIFGVIGFIHFYIPFLTAGLVFMGFYFYPSSEKSSVQKNIAYELPFATIHMSAIAGSDIEPTKIFKIIANSKEYVTVGREIRKVTNQVEMYGYDLVTALKNVASNTPNKELAELFNGLATNISSGGSLKNYLDKKAENFLNDYKLERQSYASLAGTFMDVYISILIAAPLVLMMMFIVMNVSGMGSGVGMNILFPLSIAGVVIVNLIFLGVLHVKQPKV